MKKLLIFSLIALFGGSIARAGDAHTPRPDLVVRVETCEAILREFMAEPATAIPPAVWLAHVFTQAGNSVLLVDADPSGSALEWSDLAAMYPGLAPQEAAFPSPNKG